MALDDAGLFDLVQEVMGRSETPRKLKIEWERAAAFERSSETVAAIAAALKLSSEQVDDLFVAAVAM